jgi:DNA-binding NarL/FixJ family response regulator
MSSRQSILHESPCVSTDRAGSPYTHPVRILIADDHALFRDGLRSLLTAHGHEVVAEARNGKEAIALAHQSQPDLVLMDVAMPELDGIAATRQLTSELPGVKVVVLTASETDANLFDSIKAGAHGYLIKNLEADDFFAMLDRAGRGEPALTPDFARKLLREFAKPAKQLSDAEELTAREREVLDLMVEGVTSNRKLAKRLGLSENTVKFHIRNILDKLRLHDRAQIVGYAMRKKNAEPGS